MKPNICESNMQTRRRGRPAKNGVKDPWFLLRASAVIYSYREARERGEKHSAAIREAVNFVRQFHPGMPVSETEVKRTLAELQPKVASVILVSEYSVVEGTEASKIRNKLSFRGFLPEKPGESTHTEEDPRPLKRFTLRFADPPDYPRHNATGATSCPPHDDKELTS